MLAVMSETTRQTVVRFDPPRRRYDSCCSKPATAISLTSTCVSLGAGGTGVVPVRARAGRGSCGAYNWMRTPPMKVRSRFGRAPRG